jgi:RNA polymerase sigma factor (sigma-70 family)
MLDFAALLKKLAPTLKRIVYRLDRRSGYFGADDLYQEALLHLWNEFQAGLAHDKTDSYLLQGCYFHLKNYIRKYAAKAPCISLDSPISEEGEFSLKGIIPDNFDKSAFLDGLSDNFLADTIRNNGLTTREKDILRFYSLGLTTRQIGQRLGVSHVGVIKMTQRIRKKCLRYLDNL